MLLKTVVALFVAEALASPQTATASSGCSAYELIIARGTSEPGKYGLIVGDPLLKNVQAKLPGTTGYAVQYPANNDNVKGPRIGADDTITRLNTRGKACPQTKFALVGYSQGAAVIHGAMSSSGQPYPGGPATRPKLDTTISSRIGSVNMFGDPFLVSKSGAGGKIPDFPAALTSKVKQFCAPGDAVCDPRGRSMMPDHLKYRSDPYQKDAVAWIVAGFNK